MSFVNNLKAAILKLISKKKYVDFDVKLSNKVLMLRYDRIGDMIITTPVFRELKKAYPNIEINVLASKVNYTVLNNNPYVNKVYLSNNNNIFFDLPLLFKLRKQKIDTCFEFDHSVVRHAILRLKIIKPKKVISVIKEGRYGLKGNELKVYDFYTDKKFNAHFRDIWLETLKPFDIITKANNYEIFCDTNEEKIAERFLSKFKDKFLIGINLEGAIRGKKIKNNELEEICKGLYILKNNIHIIIISSPKNDISVEQIIIKMNLNYVDKSYRTVNINSASALIKRLDMIITPDTSITHVASAFNKPIITIHEKNQESYKLFAPTSTLNRTVFSNSNKSLEGFSVKALLKNASELMKLI
jgi:ADP-heptose:LPS heptosyltransferase